MFALVQSLFLWVFFFFLFCFFSISTYNLLCFFFFFFFPSIKYVLRSTSVFLRNAWFIYWTFEIWILLLCNIFQNIIKCECTGKIYMPLGENFLNCFSLLLYKVVPLSYFKVYWFNYCAFMYISKPLIYDFKIIMDLFFEIKGCP